MPRLSDTMESGTVIKWNVKEGDEVSSGQAIADIETDKATMEMQVYDEGRIAKIMVPEGQMVNVGTVIAVLAEEGEDVKSIAGGAGAVKLAATPENGQPAAKTASPKAPSKSAARAAEPSATTFEHDQNGDGRHRVSPVARRLADEHGVDVSAINGSGPQGRVIKRDVIDAIESRDGERQKAREPARSEPGVDRKSRAPAAPIRFEPGDKPLSNMRQTIAKRLVDAKQSIPHYQVTMTFEMDAFLDLRATLNAQLESQGIKLSVNDFLVRACALAIHSHPEFNASFGGDKITVREDINVGVAVSIPRERGGGLVVATIRNADQKGLRQIFDETKKLAEKARTRGLTIEEMAGSTFTISNLGMYGVEHFTAIINPPNTAILAVGAAVEKPVVREGKIVVGRQMQATLSLDHRVIDGAMAAEYLVTLKQLIESPATLLV
jgi:pyruvate dehydrogenase E2 component (dihydrolipoamide acetyltransferase)